MKKVFKVLIMAVVMGFFSGSLCFSISKPAWIPITGNQYNMIVYGHIYIKGLDLGTGKPILYSFGPNGEKDCRSQSDIGPDGSYYATIRGNSKDETISFKVYDDKTGQIYELGNTTIFEVDTTKGDFDIQ